MLAGGLCAQERDIDSLRERLGEIDAKLEAWLLSACRPVSARLVGAP